MTDVTKQILEKKGQYIMAPKRKRRLRWGRISTVLGLVLALIIYIGYGQHQKRQELRQIEANRQVLKALESRSVSEIEARLREIREEFGVGNIALDQIPNRKYFENALFMGDSLTEAILHYDFLPPSNVVAQVGRNTMTAREDVALLENLSPTRLFLWYGQNDLTSFSTAESFASSYQDLIVEIRKVQPEAEIVLLSISPVTEAAVIKQPELKRQRMGEFNAALQKLATERGYIYLDVGGILEEEYYEPDGIHVKPRFYTVLFNHIKKEFIGRDESQ